MRFDNPSSRRSDGNPCDPVNFSFSKCDHIFQFALDRGDRCGPISNQHLMICIGVLGVKIG